jgi:hypothetical protein
LGKRLFGAVCLVSACAGERPSETFRFFLGNAYEEFCVLTKMVAKVLSIVLSKVLYISFPFHKKLFRNKIAYSRHAYERLFRRSEEFGISLEESHERVLQTIQEGNVSRMHANPHEGFAYCRYYPDNLTYQVYCVKKGEKLLIKTIIIKRGRL